MSSRSFMPGLMRQIEAAAIAATVLILLNEKNETTFTSSVVIIMLFSVSVYIFNSILLSRPKEIQISVISNLLFFALGCFFVFFYQRGLSFGNYALIIAALGIITIAGYMGIVKGVKLNGITILLDALIVLTVIFMLVIVVKETSFAALIPGLIGIAAGLIGAIIHRTDGRSGFRNFSLIIAALIVIIAASLVVYSLTGPLGGGFKAVIDGLVIAAKAIGAFFYRIMMFISRFFKPETFDGTGMEAQGVESIESAEADNIADTSKLIVLIVIAAYVLIMAILYFLLNRRRKTSGEKVKRAGRMKASSGKKVSLLKALKLAIEKIKKKIRLSNTLRRMKDEPIGRFYRLVNKMKKTKLSKQKSETPEEYLIRYRASISKEDAEYEEISELIESLNLALYGK